MTKTTHLQKPLTIALALTAALALAACGQTESPAVAPTATASPATTASPGGHGDATGGHPTAGAHTMSPSAAPSQAAVKRIDITVKGKQVTPAPATINIAAGESLTIAVTSDQDNTLHAHGFEVEKNLKAGQRGEVTVTGKQTGTFEFELHDPELRLFTVAVR